MTKKQLLPLLQTLHLDQTLEDILSELIDNADSVDTQLLSAISDILDLQKEWYLKQASLLIEEADIYNQFAKKKKRATKNDMDDKIKRLKDIQKTLEKFIHK